MPKITNKYNLPSAFVNLSEDMRNPTEKHYSATTLLKPTRQVALERRHFNEIEVDVADRVWLIFGTAVHKILEEADHSGYAEVKMSEVIKDDYILTGIMDLYNESLSSVEDYKTASVWKIIHKDFDDWKKQGLIYAWLARKTGKLVTKLRFHALLKDWSPTESKLAKLKGSFYPEHPIWTWEYEITEDDIQWIEEFIRTRFDELIASEKLSDDELPLCTPEERWNSGDKYAVYLKATNKAATRVFNTEEEAKAFVVEKNAQATAKIEYRKGEDKRCENYCQCCKFCKYYQENVNKEEK